MLCFQEDENYLFVVPEKEDLEHIRYLETEDFTGNGYDLINQKWST